MKRKVPPLNFASARRDQIEPKKGEDKRKKIALSNRRVSNKIIEPITLDDHLPNELQALILLHIFEWNEDYSQRRESIETILNATLVCKKWFEMIQRDQYWRTIFLQRFTETDLELFLALREESFWACKFKREEPPRSSRLDDIGYWDDEEKENAIKAARSHRNNSMCSKHFVISKALDPFEFDLSVEPSYVTLGGTVNLKIKVTNVSDEARSLYMGHGFERDNINIFQDGSCIDMYNPANMKAVGYNSSDTTFRYRQYIGYVYRCGTGMRDIHSTIPAHEWIEYTTQAQFVTSERKRRNPEGDMVNESTSIHVLRTQRWELTVPTEGTHVFFYKNAKHMLSNSVTLELRSAA